MYDYYQRMYQLISDYREEYKEHPRRVIRKIMKENIKALFRKSKRKGRLSNESLDALSRDISKRVISDMSQKYNSGYIKNIQNEMDLTNNIFEDSEIRKKIEDQLSNRDVDKERTIPVIFITDNRYAYPTAVAISSMMYNAKNPEAFDVYVIGDNLDDDMKQIIEMSGVHVTIVDANKNFAEVNFNHAHVTKAALNKFYISEMFPNINKALYLDSDMLFLKDLSDLYSIELGTNIVAAVSDYHIITSDYMTVINEEGCTNYFNSGMLLMNLSAMRDDGYAERLLKKKVQLSNDIRFTFMDQDALNLAFYGRIKYLPIKYNFLNVYYSEKSEFDMHEISGLPMKEVIDAYDKPYVLHIGGGNKPWNSLLGERLSLYRYYRTVNRIYREINEKDR